MEVGGALLLVADHLGVPSIPEVNPFAPQIVSRPRLVAVLLPAQRRGQAR